MEKNVGRFDRTVRITLGTLLTALTLVSIAGLVNLGTTWTLVVLAAGALLLTTGITQSCLLYRVVGASTRSEDSREDAASERPT